MELILFLLFLFFCSVLILGLVLSAYAIERRCEELGYWSLCCFFLAMVCIFASYNILGLKCNF
jgi:hypothetical protein